MIARLVITTGVVGSLLLARVRADLPVAPPPREVHVDGSRDPVPQPTNSEPEDPAAIVARIIENSTDASERLSQTDTGSETQQKQATVLKDIDTLLNQQDNPSGGGAGDKDQNPDTSMDPKPEDQEKDSKKNDSEPNGMDMQPMKQDQQPMAGQDPQPERRPRQDRPGSEPKEKTEGKPQDAGTSPKPENGSDKKEPKMPESKGGSEPKDDKDEKNEPPSGGVPMGKIGNNQPSLPLDEDVAKKVWGGPRDQLRKQVDQYYSERFMPGYSGLLKSYYSHLAAEGANK